MVICHLLYKLYSPSLSPYKLCTLSPFSLPPPPPPSINTTTAPPPPPSPTHRHHTHHTTTTPPPSIQSNTAIKICKFIFSEPKKIYIIRAYTTKT
ncbi:hypothetical protein HanXRQr2_Chr05g0220121 [Helianthus annuus]|uniref:Uncharacterized protein n=1 Tax=Helianthus annuus TaxID=4232 RepID=A0A9K3NMP4_HELAN|nr:hypothetical protein HanXRQr2_Chr05g0220121 [Helianthus annuus]KAJ0577502.1 hypothetical protein HanIR_Chr05g0236711 [Helianthus annuus]